MSCFDSIHLIGRNMLENIEEVFFEDKGNLTWYSFKRFIFAKKENSLYIIAVHPITSIWYWKMEKDNSYLKKHWFQCIFNSNKQSSLNNEIHIKKEVHFFSFPPFIYISTIRQAITLSKQLYVLTNKHRSIAIIWHTCTVLYENINSLKAEWA